MVDHDPVERRPPAGQIAPDEVSEALAGRLARLYNYYRIGVAGLALLLPVLVVGVGRWGFNDVFDSVSAYYYSATGSFFVGFLFVLATFFAIYGAGLETDATPTEPRTRREFVRDVVAAVAAVVVAVFPTERPGDASPSEAAQTIATVHFLAAITVFLILAWLAFGFYLHSRRRNPGLSMVSLIGAVLITAGVIWALLQGLNDGPIVWPEILAVAAFGATWLVHGIARMPPLRTQA